MMSPSFERMVYLMRQTIALFLALLLTFCAFYAYADQAGTVTPGTFRLGTSVYTIILPDGFVEEELTEEDREEDMVAYLHCDTIPLDFDVYQFSKEGFPEDLAEYTRLEAVTYGAFEIAAGEKINGIDVGWYRARESFEGQEYLTLCFLLDDGDRYVEISFWIRGDSSEEAAQAVMNTLTFVQREE